MECIILNNIYGGEVEVAIQHITWMSDQTQQYGNSLVGIESTAVYVKETLYQIKELIETSAQTCSFYIPH